MKQLKAIGKGEWAYDYNNDMLTFKTKDRDYNTSLEFENLILDIDKEGFITGLRIMDASTSLKLAKISLSKIKNFEFISKIKNNIVTIQLRFTSEQRNKDLQYAQDFVREASTSIQNSELICTVA